MGCGLEKNKVSSHPSLRLRSDMKDKELLDRVLMVDDHRSGIVYLTQLRCTAPEQNFVKQSLNHTARSGHQVVSCQSHRQTHLGAEQRCDICDITFVFSR